jgi:hypothetical protein
VSGVLECPRERSGHRIIYHDGAIFAFGGYNPSLEEDEEMQKDVDWQTSKPLFKELWHQSHNTFRKLKMGQRRRYDTQHNDIQPNDSQPNDTQHNV